MRTQLSIRLLKAFRRRQPAQPPNWATAQTEENTIVSDLPSDGSQLLALNIGTRWADQSTGLLRTIKAGLARMD
jgi:hypothetical protein